MPANGGGAMPPPSPASLLLLPRFPPPGTGGALPGTAGGFPIPGMAGAPIGAALAPSLTFPVMGADRSLTWVTFLSFIPLLISPSSAPWGRLAAA